MGRLTKALELTMPRLCPAMALQQLLEQRRQRPTRAPVPAPTPTPATRRIPAAATRATVGSVR